jgi:hypothetical protein
MRFAFGVIAFGPLIGVFSTASAQIAVDFDTPGDLVNQFSLNASPAGIKYTQVATGGLANSGAVDLLNTTDSDHTTAAYNGRFFGFDAPGRSVTISSFVRRRNASASQTPWLMLGVLSDLNERMDAGVGTSSYASIRLDPGAGAALPSDVILRTETKVSGGSRVRVTPGQTGSLLAGNWYRLSATFTYNSATDLLIGMDLEDWGTTGAALQSNVFSLAPTLINLSGLDQVNGDSTVWVGFRAFHEGGADLLDNFAATPEPASLALLGAAAFLGRRRLARCARSPRSA